MKQKCLHTKPNKATYAVIRWLIDSSCDANGVIQWTVKIQDLEFELGIVEGVKHAIDLVHLEVATYAPKLNKSTVDWFKVALEFVGPAD